GIAASDPACVVHEHVEAAEAREDLVDDLVPARLVRHVLLEERDLLAELRRGRVPAVRVATGDDDADRPVRERALGDRAADARAPAGDEPDLVGEARHPPSVTKGSASSRSPASRSVSSRLQKAKRTRLRPASPAKNFEAGTAATRARVTRPPHHST